MKNREIQDKLHLFLPQLEYGEKSKTKVGKSELLNSDQGKKKLTDRCFELKEIELGKQGEQKKILITIKKIQRRFFGVRFFVSLYSKRLGKLEHILGEENGCVSDFKGRV